jgi:AcrR family transcriptional regulator
LTEYLVINIVYQPVGIIPTGRDIFMEQKREISFNKAYIKKTKRIHAIAEVSARLFSKNGYLPTSMDDVAAAAKITKGGLYHYFPSKTEILYLVCSTYVYRDFEGLEQSLSELKESTEKIKFIVFRHIEHYVAHVAEAKTLLNEAYNLPPKYLKEVRAIERRYFEIASKVISEFLGDKSRKDLVTVLAFTLFGMMNWIYSWYDPKGAVKPKELSQLIYETFTMGIRNSKTNETAVGERL